MTIALNGEELCKKLAEALPGSVVSGEKLWIIVDSQQLYPAAEYLKNTAGLDFD